MGAGGGWQVSRGWMDSMEGRALASDRPELTFASALGHVEPLADSLCQLPEPVQWLSQATLQLLPAHQPAGASTRKPKPLMKIRKTTVGGGSYKARRWLELREVKLNHTGSEGRT